ncbi:MAG TPA: acyltransferase [Devosia sp.]|nr:acyltransferase [Devosia sp.]
MLPTERFAPGSRLPPEERRLAALDGLRGIAACIVLFHHVTWPSHITGLTFVTNGYIAVDLFFVLSGYIISRKYMWAISGGAAALRFVCLRFFRLYPLHLFVLLLFVAFEVAKLVLIRAFGFAPGDSAPFTGTESIPLLIANIFLLQSFNVSSFVSWNGPSWSISGEMFSYLVFLIVPLTGLLRMRWLAAVLALGALGTYVWVGYQSQYSNMTSEWGFVRALAGFAAGVVICLMEKRQEQPIADSVPWRLDAVVVGAILVLMAIVQGPWLYTVVGFAVVLVAMLRGDQGAVANLLSLPLPQLLGRLSYSIYLLHAFVAVFLTDLIRYLLPGEFAASVWFGDVLIVVFIVLTLAGSALTYRFVEMPGRQLGRAIANRMASPAKPLAT